jgi:23S rRNA-/tRNA-specific pseudouridylate synthase
VPYKYTFTSFAKRRWLNRSLVEVLLEEFKKYDREHYLRAIDEGLLTINGDKIDRNAVIQEHDVIRYEFLQSRLIIGISPNKTLLCDIYSN